MAAFSFGGAIKPQSLFDQWRKQKAGGQTASSTPGYLNYGANQPTQGSNTGAWYTRAQQQAGVTAYDRRMQAAAQTRLNNQRFAQQAGNVAGAIGGAIGGAARYAFQQYTSPGGQSGQTPYMPQQGYSQQAHNQQQQYQMMGSQYDQTPRGAPRTTTAASTLSQQPMEGPSGPLDARHMNQAQLREYMGGGPTQYGGLDPVEMRWQAKSAWNDRRSTWGVGGYVPPRTNTSGGYGSGGYGGYGYSDWGGGGGGGGGWSDAGSWYNNMIQWSINKPNPG